MLSSQDQGKDNSPKVSCLLLTPLESPVMDKTLVEISGKVSCPYLTTLDSSVMNMAEVEVSGKVSLPDTTRESSHEHGRGGSFWESFPT